MGIGALLILVSACISTHIEYDIPPSSYAITGITSIYVDTFTGQKAGPFKDTLIRETYKTPVFDSLDHYPKPRENAAIISGEVLIYAIRDEEVTRPKKVINLIKHDLQSRPDNSSNRLRQQAFEFVEVSFEERVIHRVLDLQIRLIVTSTKTSQVLYQKDEIISFQQSYLGEDAIREIPSAEHEMQKLGQKLFQRFLEKLNPALRTKTLVLETGSAPVPWTAKLVDLGHPGILSGNRFAVRGEYERAIKIWNYVIFAPYVFESSEHFHFTDTVYAQLNAALLPRVVIQPLLKLHEQTFNLIEIDRILIKLLSRDQFQNYGMIIKSHARTSKNRDSKNLAAAHYNLGSVYQLLNKMKLAPYHFAQANAWSPKAKYAQAWTDIQHELGNYNPLDTLMDRTIEEAGKQPPPPEALVQPSLAIATDKKTVVEEHEGYERLKPEELPLLFEENTRPSGGLTPEAIMPTGESSLDLN
ncbi:hypothetical protein WDW89_01265 [Deltaproteobacteria bacterium TL4]